MTKRCTLVLFAVALATGWPAISAQQKATPGGYVVEHDQAVARNDPARTTGAGKRLAIRFSARHLD
jgi:hypothetical protein